MTAPVASSNTVDVKVDPLAELPSLRNGRTIERPTSTALASYATPSAQLQAVLQWAIANPFGKAIECARHFGIHRHTAARIMNCDAFKVAYANMLKEANTTGGHTLQEKISGAIAQGVELLEERMEVADNKFLLGAVNTLAQLQDVVAPKAADQPSVNLTVNNQVVALGEARSEMLDRARQAGPYPGDAKRIPISPLATDATPYPDRADE
jgi:hypothetical protein